MATATETSAASASLPEGSPYRLSADDYFRMVEADVFPPDRHVGLWKGQLYEKRAKKLRHGGAQSKIAATLWSVLSRDWCVWIESPILVDDFTAPVPDLCLLRGDPDVYTRRGSSPKLGEIGLVIEVADSSLRENPTETLSVYARAGLPSYWVVNLVARRIEVFSAPEIVGAIAKYATVASLEPEMAVPLMLDGREVALIPVRDLLPVETT